jgi:hypothetical protein
MSLEHYFPYRPLGEAEFAALTELAGGSPITQSNLGGLLSNLAIPMLQSGLAKHLLVMGARECGKALDTNRERGEQMFHRGALLYSAVLAEYSPLSKIPCEPTVFFDIGRADGDEFIWAANERITEEVPSFCQFMGEVSVALDLASPVDYRLAKAGAGLVHIMTTESLRPQETHDFELEHPELADLEPLFREIDGA